MTCRLRCCCIRGVRTLLVVCNPKQDSLNHALSRAIEDNLCSGGHEVDFVDLYAEKFDPRLELHEFQRKFSFDEAIRRYTRLLVEADLILFVHPDWWGGMPALMHGFLDRVFRPGIAYEYAGPEFGRKTPSPLLTGKHAAAFVTSDMSKPKDGLHPLETVWSSHVFQYCGMEDHGCHVLYGVHDSRYRQRVQWIRDCVSLCQTIAGDAR